MSTKMQLAKSLPLAAFCFCLISVPVFASEPSGHSHDAVGTPVKLSLDSGKKWASDEPLRMAMTNIRNAMDKSLHAIHEDRLSATKYGALAKKVNGEVGYMVSNCKLEPKADAQLHLIIAEMLEGVEAMDGKLKTMTRQDGAVKVIGALESYSTYFDDPSWKPIKH
jgi:hypothetical protein